MVMVANLVTAGDSGTGDSDGDDGSGGESSSDKNPDDGECFGECADAAMEAVNGAREACEFADPSSEQDVATAEQAKTGCHRCVGSR